MNKRLLVLFSFALLAVTAARADNNITGFAMLSLPTGDFADDAASGAGSGFATTGFGVGGEYNVPIDSKSFFWSSSAFWIFNPTDEDELKKSTGASSASGLNYWNVPILTGVKFQGAVSPAFSAYAMGQAGFNYKNATDGELGDGAGGTVKAKVTGAGAFAFAFGAGIILKQQLAGHRVHFSGRFMSLGKPSLKVKLSNGGSNSSKGETSLIAILAGLDF